MKINKASNVSKKANFKYLSIWIPAVLLSASIAQANEAGYVTSPNQNHIDVADLHFDQGRVIKFIATPDTNEIHIGEIVPVSANESSLLTDEILGLSAVDIFKTLTPKHIPVPELLSNYSKDNTGTIDNGDGANLIDRDGMVKERAAQNQRSLSSEVNQKYFIDVNDIGIKPVEVLAAQGGSCGSDGYHYFKENHCGRWGAGGYGKAQSHCDAGLSSWIQRTSSQSMRHTYTRMATCGTTGKLRHSRKALGGFKTVLTYHQQSNFVSQWTTKKSGVAWKRRARFERTSNSGGVRGWTHFFKQLTQ